MKAVDIIMLTSMFVLVAGGVADYYFAVTPAGDEEYTIMDNLIAGMLALLAVYCGKQ